MVRLLIILMAMVEMLVMLAALTMAQVRARDPGLVLLAQAGGQTPVDYIATKYSLVQVPATTRKAYGLQSKLQSKLQCRALQSKLQSKLQSELQSKLQRDGAAE